MLTRSHRTACRTAVAGLLAAALVAPAIGAGADASASAAKTTAKPRHTVRLVFHPRTATRHRLRYRLHGIKGRKVVSVKLRGKKGKKVVLKPIKIVPKPRKPKPATPPTAPAPASDPPSAPSAPAPSGGTPSVADVVASTDVLTVQRPPDLPPVPPPAPEPVLVVTVVTPPAPPSDPVPATPPASDPPPVSSPSPPASIPGVTDAVSAPSPCGPILPVVPVGGARPPACWRPYAATSPFNVALPTNPQLASNSAAIVARTTGWGPPQNLVAGWAGTANDWARPTYFSAPGDPEYTLHCTKDWGPCTIEGMKVRIPDGAAPAGGGDGHMQIVDQESGWEYGLWQVTRRATGGGRLDFSYGGRTRIDGDGLGDGSLRLNGGNAAGWGGAAGLLRAEELEAGQIDHALLITVPCDNDTYVYPAHHLGAACGAGERADAPAMGQRFYLAMTSAQIDALAVPAWKKTLLHAMADYGMVVGDTGGSAWAIEFESGVQYTSLGRTDKWVALAKKYGLYYSASSGAYAFNIRDGVDWARYLRVVAPCVSARSC